LKQSETHVARAFIYHRSDLIEHTARAPRTDPSCQTFKLTPRPLSRSAPIGAEHLRTQDDILSLSLSLSLLGQFFRVKSPLSILSDIPRRFRELAGNFQQAPVAVRARAILGGFRTNVATLRKKKKLYKVIGCAAISASSGRLIYRLPAAERRIGWENTRTSGTIRVKK